MGLVGTIGNIGDVIENAVDVLESGAELVGDIVSLDLEEAVSDLGEFAEEALELSADALELAGDLGILTPQGAAGAVVGAALDMILPEELVDVVEVGIDAAAGSLPGALAEAAEVLIRV